MPCLTIVRLCVKGRPTESFLVAASISIQSSSVIDLRRLAAQTEMPDGTSFSELPAARKARFGDFGVIEAVKLMNAGSMSINGGSSKGKLDEPCPGTDLHKSNQAGWDC